MGLNIGINMSSKLKIKVCLKVQFIFCFSGLPKNRTADEIRDEMSKLTDGVTAVCIYNSYSDKTKTRGYAFVEYLTHRHAALARRKLVPG